MIPARMVKRSGYDSSKERMTDAMRGAIRNVRGRADRNKLISLTSPAETFLKK
jgi:hypothetical protein